jgi:hypothetical protein
MAGLDEAVLDAVGEAHLIEGVAPGGGALQRVGEGIGLWACSMSGPFDRPGDRVQQGLSVDRFVEERDRTGVFRRLAVLVVVSGGHEDHGEAVAVTLEQAG